MYKFNRFKFWLYWRIWTKWEKHIKYLKSGIILSMIFNENNKDKSEEKSNEFSFIKKKDISQSNEKEILTGFN